MNIKEDLDLLESKLKDLHIEYEKYFSGILKQEPARLKREVTQLVRKYTERSLGSTSLQFRYNNLASRFSTYDNYWTRITRQIEEGTFSRDRFKLSIDKKLEELEKQSLKLPEVEPHFKQIYLEYINAKMQCNESIENITIEKLAETLKRQSQKIKETYKANDVDFKVAIEEGKAKIKAIVK